MGRTIGKFHVFAAQILLAAIGLLAAVSMVALPAAAAEIKSGGTAVAILGGDVPTINPGVSSSISNQFVSGQVYSTLVRLDLKGNPQPYLAESWEISPDGKTYTFRLRKDVKWHDGKPFTSADVAYGLLQINKKYSGHASTAFKSVKRIDTPDPHTAVFHLEFAYPPLIRALGFIVSSVVLPKHIYEGTDPRKNPHNFKPIGTGPFRFKEYKKGSHVTLERNPDYFKKGRPYLDRIIYQIIPNKAARVLALEKGEADYIPYVAMPFAEVKRLASNPKAQSPKRRASPRPGSSSASSTLGMRPSARRRSGRPSTTRSTATRS